MIHDDDHIAARRLCQICPAFCPTIGPALRADGLAVSQLPEQINGQPGLRTTLMHVSGQMVSSVTPLTINAGKNGTQEWGKAMTYTRRYALQAVLGLCVGIEDNDADLEPTAPPVRGGKTEPAAAKPQRICSKREGSLHRHDPWAWRSLRSIHHCHLANLGRRRHGQCTSSLPSKPGCARSFRSQFRIYGHRCGGIDVVEFPGHGIQKQELDGMDRGADQDPRG